MLRNKVGIKKMITVGGLVLFHTLIPCDAMYHVILVNKSLWSGIIVHPSDKIEDAIFHQDEITSTFEIIHMLVIYSKKLIL
jgi:hypothetical protein